MRNKREKKMTEMVNLWSAAWYSWMFSMFWQVSLLVIIIGGIDLLLRNWLWPQVRYALWIMVLVKLVIPPSWSSDIGIISKLRPAGIEKRSENMVAEERGVNNENISLQHLSEKSNDEKSINARKDLPYANSEDFIKHESRLSWKSYLMGGWILGILIFGAALLHRISKLKRWHIEQEKKKNIPPWFHDALVKVGDRLAIQRLPAIVFSNETLTPAVYGIFRPVLLLPENYIEKLNEVEAEHVLMHELAHIKRGDLIVHGLCLILQIIYWFNPFLIWMRKQMKYVREICCDITIADLLREKTQKYKDTLVKTARELLTETMEPGMGLLGLFEEPYQLIARIKWLNRESWKSKRLANLSAAAISLVLTAFVLPMGEIAREPAITRDMIKIDERENEHYISVIGDANDKLNSAFLKWDFNEIRKYYTVNAVIEHESRPSISGIGNIMNDFMKQKSEGIKFNEMQNFIADLWTDGNDIHVVENFLYSLSIYDETVSIAGSGRSYTIWEFQNDDSIKIKYSIYNLVDIKPVK
jgi:beta-lactamase regulating signal transducer with metallopeptidase domain